ncbi:hypothetical protein LINPERPRIM_LOCUS2238 [Linum perenne]
MPAPRGLS